MRLQLSANSATTLAALGIVYGDIGTSPLYALKESFRVSSIIASEANVMGFVSLIIWSLLLIVTLKYVLFILRADNNGEGGVVVLMQQAMHHLHSKYIWIVMMMGLTGTALFYGDAMITPAVSVLSAAEGLTIIHESFRPYVMPIALGILFVLFLIQKKGTHRIGTLFGPIMLLWFSAIALIGLFQIILSPKILLALNPYYGLYFVINHGWDGFISLGCIVLAVTGAEALYADMGHFGRQPIQTAWIKIVLPSLLINYLGQGALILRNPFAIKNPFFLSVPHWLLIPFIILATFATIIASQAVIAGAYSLTRQAIQLGFAPRMTIIHTNDKEIGQIYLPLINWLLLTAVTLVVLVFHDSEHLASAYGIAVTGTMVITTLLFSIVMIKNWHWPIPMALLLTAVFLCFDLIFFSSNLLKLIHGGWFPVMVALIVVTIFATWRRGQQQLKLKHQNNEFALDDFIQNLHDYPLQIVAGNAVFMVSDPFDVPRALLHNLKHNKVLHNYNVILTVRTKEVPHIKDSERIAMKQLGFRFIRVIADYGFQETAEISHILFLMAEQGISLEIMETSFFLSHDSIIVAPKTKHGNMGRLRARIFKWLYTNSTTATNYYHIPANRVIELGAQVKI